MELALKSRLERCSTLPTLPAVAIKVLDLCQRDNLDLGEIAKVIANDPALAAKMLKTVNSPAFALRQEVRTLSHAVALLGVNSVRTLVLSFSLLRDVRRGQRAALNTYWKRSVLAGVGAREVAAALRFPFKEEAFLAALLQDIGMLALRQLGDPIYNDLVETAGYDHDRIAAGERATFECDHAEVGAWLIGRWRLPDRFRTSTIYSHRPWRLEADADPDLANLVRLTALSGLLADIWIHPDATGAAQRAHIEAAKIFRLPSLSIEEVVRNMAVALPEVGGLFEVDLGTPETMGKVLEQAQEALNILSVTGMPAPRVMEDLPTTQMPRVLTPLGSEPEGHRDDVTGLPGGNAAFSYISEQLGLARRSNEPLSVIVAELDFGAGEGPDGLPIGDDLLRSIAERLGQRLRKRDVLARVAGGRFLLVLPETTGPGAVVVAERSRVHISELPHRMSADSESAVTPVTMSFGCVTYQGNEPILAPTLIALADEALQISRAAGGNRVTVHHADRAGNVARA